jgi:hypothetical protein
MGVEYVMYNTIKKINFEVIFERLIDFQDNKTEKELENYCINIENSKEFQGLFFFKETDCHNYFYELKNEQNIKDFLKQYFTDEFLENDLFVEYGEYLLNCENEDDIIKIPSYLGKIIINESALYESLQEEFLRNDDIIKRLVNANDFYEEMIQIKKDCLKYLFEMMIADVKDDIDNYEFL